MISTNCKYYLDNTLQKTDQDKWLELLDYAFGIAEQVEFNILNRPFGKPDIPADLSIDLVDQGKRKDKIYHSGKFIRFQLTKSIKEFIISKSYSDWYNFYIEDISFLKDGIEFFATITHENYVIVQLSESYRNDLNKKGFHFDSEWPYNPDKKTLR
jgi:hypothetical protein